MVSQGITMTNYYLKHTGEFRFSDLQFQFCGRETCEPLYSYGPCVRPTYIIHYILKGKGIFQVSGETVHLQEKEGFLIEPGVQTFYQADKDDPWTYCWIGFDGILAPVLLKELGLGGNRLTFCCNEIDELKEIFAAFFRYQQFSQVNALLLESEMYRFFCCADRFFPLFFLHCANHFFVLTDFSPFFIFFAVLIRFFLC